MVRRAGLEFCCLSVPLVNVGVYLATLECLFVSLCLFCLAIFAPPIVAGMDVLPPWYKPALAGLGGFSVVLHLLGLTTIARQSTTWYRAYLRIHFAATLTVLVLSITGIVVMAMGHDRAAATCRSLYGNEPFNSGKGIRVDMLSDALKDSGRVICNVFTYIQLGAMAGLIALMGLTQVRVQGPSFRMWSRGTSAWQWVSHRPRLTTPMTVVWVWFADVYVPLPASVRATAERSFRQAGAQGSRVSVCCRCLA
ncbi:hypothetical protein ACQY0O_007697 [Thecaphora frezii]